MAANHALGAGVVTDLFFCKLAVRRFDDNARIDTSEWLVHQRGKVTIIPV
jgi:hypothetical protein